MLAVLVSIWRLKSAYLKEKGLCEFLIIILTATQKDRWKDCCIVSDVDHGYLTWSVCGERKPGCLSPSLTPCSLPASPGAWFTDSQGEEGFPPVLCGIVQKHHLEWQKYAKGSLAQHRLRETSPPHVLSGGASRHLSESRGKGWEEWLSPCLLSLHRSSRSSTRDFLSRRLPSLLNEQDTARPVQIERLQSKQVPFEKPSSSTWCLFTICKLQEHHETVEQTEKAVSLQMPAAKMIFSCWANSCLSYHWWTNRLNPHEIISSASVL